VEIIIRLRDWRLRGVGLRADFGHAEAQLEGVFVNYHRLSGEQFRVIGVKGPNKARKRIKDN
jgi:hypothetical protein